MKSTIKCAILLSLLSSTALAAPKTSIAKNSPHHQNKVIKNIEGYNIKPSAKSGHSNYAAAHKHFKAFEVKEVVINLEGIEQQKEFNDICAAYVGKYMTHEMMSELSAKLTKHLVSQDYLVPKIDMKEHKGRLSVNVKVSSIDYVVILGEGKNSELMNEYANKILESKPAKVKYVQRYLALMNKVPGYDVEYKLEEKAGSSSEVELIVATQKTKGEAFVGVDNYGVSDLGKMQTAAAVQMYSPNGGPDAFMINGSTTNYPDRLNDIGVGYNRVINSYGTNASLSFAHSTSNSTKNDTVHAEDNTGNNVRLAFNHYLYLVSKQNLEGTFGLNYKDSNSYVVDDITNKSRTDQKANYTSADLGLKYIVKDSWDGHNMMHLVFVQGVGGSFKQYKDGGVLDAADAPDKHFNIIKFDIYKDQPLVNNFSMFSHISANYSGHQLPSQEMFTLGGRDFGRGYSFGTIEGNGMLAASLELRYNHKMEDNMFIDDVQPYIFHDMGYVGKQYGDTDITHLSSNGGGLRLKLRYDIDFGAEVAVPEKKHYKVDGEKEEAKTKFGVYVNKSFKF